jgi:hypothetical protein
LIHYFNKKYEGDVSDLLGHEEETSALTQKLRKIEILKW